MISIDYGYLPRFRILQIMRAHTTHPRSRTDRRDLSQRRQHHRHRRLSKSTCHDMQRRHARKSADRLGCGWSAGDGRCVDLRGVARDEAAAAGEYGIVRDAYGRPLGFIYGWTQFLIARTASAAALAVGFAIFLNDLLQGALKHPYFEYTLPGGHVISFGRLQLVALTAIIVTTLINCAAVRVSGGVASVLTGTKLVLVAWCRARCLFLQWWRLGKSL